MATIAVLTSSIDSTLMSYASADVAGDQFLNDGWVILLIRNLGGSGITLTITPGNVPYSGGAYSAVTVAVGSNEYYLVGPFRVDVFNDASGYVQLSYSGVTSVTLAPIRVGS